MSSHAIQPVPDLYAGPNDPAAPAYVVNGGEFDDIARAQHERGEEIMVVNFGPQHPSTHGVLRLILELDGETVINVRPGIGFLHTGIEKNMEYRTWTQGVSYCTRMNYVSSLLNESAYCLAVERLMGIENDVPERAQDIRVMMGELQRIASHLVAVGTGALEIGASTPTMLAFRERDVINDMIEAVSGLRMNQSFIRPGGVAQDLPSTGVAQLRETIAWLEKNLPDHRRLTVKNPLLRGRFEGVAVMDLSACMALGVSGPPLRGCGLEWDLRRKQPYFTYDKYEFDVPHHDGCDAYARFMVRMDEMVESVKILKQCADRLEASTGQPVMVADKRVAWPAQLSVGTDGQGNSHEHIKHIMGESMEALIQHFKIVTEGFKVPAGQIYSAIEGSAGELGVHLVSDGGNRPYRAHFRDPGFTHIQSLPILMEGGMVADLPVAVASLDPVMGGVDR